MNPGGPGASGIAFLESAGPSFPSQLRQRFNLVSFDPRGIGASDPVDCVSPAGLRQWLAVNPAPVTARQVDGVVAAVRRFVAGCEAHTSPLLLANVSTQATAEDMNRLRIALGQRSLTYLGFSYGTYLGALFAQDFPTRVRAMVLDGAVDPALGTVETSIEQAAGLEVDLHDFFAWCPDNASCAAELPGGAARAFGQLTAAPSPWRRAASDAVSDDRFATGQLRRRRDGHRLDAVLAARLARARSGARRRAARQRHVARAARGRLCGHRGGRVRHEHHCRQHRHLLPRSPVSQGRGDLRGAGPPHGGGGTRLRRHRGLGSHRVLLLARGRRRGAQARFTPLAWRRSSSSARRATR